MENFCSNIKKHQRKDWHRQKKTCSLSHQTLPMSFLQTTEEPDFGKKLSNSSLTTFLG